MRRGQAAIYLLREGQALAVADEEVGREALGEPVGVVDGEIVDAGLGEDLVDAVPAARADHAFELCIETIVRGVQDSDVKGDVRGERIIFAAR
mgnify:CR=1 FL=1